MPLFRTLDFSEVLPDKLYLSGVYPVNEENLKKMGISCVVRGERVWALKHRRSCFTHFTEVEA